MRLKKRSMGRYEGRLGPYEIRVRSNAALRSSWNGQLMITRNAWNLVRGRTLEVVKHQLLILYLKRRLNILLEQRDGEEGFKALYQACWGFKDDLAPSALADWLEERGDGFIALVAGEGDRAGVRWWPAGWAEALARASTSPG